MSKYRTDAEQLTFLENRIQRLEKTLERLESLGMVNISSAGQSKSFRWQEEIRQELERAVREWEITKAKTEGNTMDGTIKEVILCSREKY